MTTTTIVEYDKGFSSLETELFKIIKFSKFNFNDCSKVSRDDLQLPGIYFISRENTGENDIEREIYIGQTNNGFSSRVKDSNHVWNGSPEPDLAIWITAVNRKSWTKNYLDYFENFFIKLFSSKTRMKLLNKSNGNKNNSFVFHSEIEFRLNKLSREIQEKLNLIVGDKFFYETPEFEDIKNFNISLENEEFVEIYAKDKKTGVKVKAFLNKKTNSVMLKKGTLIKNSHKLPVKLNKEIIIDNENKLQNDIWINSPSRAAVLVSGWPTANGWGYWRTIEDDKSISELRQK